jgi:hypothetical protein
MTQIHFTINDYSSLTLLKFSAILSGLIYLLIFTLPFPLTKFYATIPPVDYTKLTGYSAAGFWRYLVGLTALFGLYIWAIRLTAPTNSIIGGRFIFIPGAVFAAILLFSYPITAIDMFVYAILSRGWALYNLQPFATTPEAWPTSDLWLGLAAEWIDVASPYGVVWEALSLGAFYAGGGNFLAQLFALKIIGLLAYLGCAWLVHKILSDVQPKWAITGTLAFAWNPLVLFESVQNAHNDIVMVFFMLAAVWVFIQLKPPLFGVKKRTFSLLVCLLLAFSILVKLMTVIIVPFFLLVLTFRYPTWPRRFAVFILYGLFIILVVVLPMLPYWPGLDNWAVVQVGSGAGRSLLALLVLALRDSLGTNLAFDISRNLIMAAWGPIYLYLLWQFLAHLHRRYPTSKKPAGNQSPNLPIFPAFYALFWYVLLAAPVFHAWYLLWFLPLAALLLPRQTPLLASIVFSITALLVIPYFETIRVWYPYLLQNHLVGHLVGVPLLILPPALALRWTISLTPNSEV